MMDGIWGVEITQRERCLKHTEIEASAETIQDLADAWAGVEWAGVGWRETEGGDFIKDLDGRTLSISYIAPF